MACTYWVGVARIVRAEFLKLRERDYVLAARALGLSNARIMFAHVAPNVAHLLIVLFTLLFVEAIKAEVVLSFLGVGIVNEPSWGILISDAENELVKGLWWQITFTSAALFGIVLALQVFGDALRDALDPRLRQ
jgi:peptide/nickel transport system permease protein